MNDEKFEIWKADILNKLEMMIDDWESRIPADVDDTLYTLALRRAYDLILTGEIPNLR